MKKVEIIIRPQVLDVVRVALEEAGVRGLNYSEVKGYGQQKGHCETYRGQTIFVEYVHKVRLEVVVTDAMLESVVGAVEKVARTGHVGDGKIFITDMYEVIRIRTGERGDIAV